MIKNIVIVGGGSSGWMAAAGLNRVLNKDYNITLVESEEIGIIGVGEATIPSIVRFNYGLGIDEIEFIKETKATFKLGIEFINWARKGDTYIHGFSKLGTEFDGPDFQHYWLSAQNPNTYNTLDKYSVNSAMIRSGKFIGPIKDNLNSPLADISYAYQFDAQLYAKFLRKLSESRGVKRVEGKIINVLQKLDGSIDTLELENGLKVSGDFFIDCSGFRGLLIEQTLKSGYEDWSHWLPCDTAIAVPCTPSGQVKPLTTCTAHSAGWQWRIPLQHRTGNGHVFSSKYMSSDEATSILLENLDGEPLADPRTVKFVPGIRKQTWIKNCVSLGLASGFIEPLESTSIHLVIRGISKLGDFFPRSALDQVDIDQYNKEISYEYAHIRDFIILHYHATERTDSDFWNYVRKMQIPETLNNKMSLYKSNARVIRDSNDFFGLPSWVQVMAGQRIVPKSYHPLVDLTSKERTKAFLDNVENVIQEFVGQMPAHEEYLNKILKDTRCGS